MGLLTRKVHSTLFPSQLIRLLHQHSVLLGKLEERVNNWHHMQKVGDLFSGIHTFFMYKKYILCIRVLYVYIFYTLRECSLYFTQICPFHNIISGIINLRIFIDFIVEWNFCKRILWWKFQKHIILDIYFQCLRSQLKAFSKYIWIISPTSRYSSQSWPKWRKPTSDFVTSFTDAGKKKPHVSDFRYFHFYTILYRYLYIAIQYYTGTYSFLLLFFV